MKRIQDSDEHLRASMENLFIHSWGTIIHGCELSTNGVQHMFVWSHVSPYPQRTLIVITYLFIPIQVLLTAYHSVWTTKCSQAKNVINHGQLLQACKVATSCIPLKDIIISLLIHMNRPRNLLYLRSIMGVWKRGKGTGLALCKSQKPPPLSRTVSRRVRNPETTALDRSCRVGLQSCPFIRITTHGVNT